MERGAIDISGLRCAPCLKRGHDCYAHGEVDGEPWCVFCQDGEPCAYESRHKLTAATTKTRKPGERGILALSKSLLKSGLSDSDVRGALLNQGFNRGDVDRIFPRKKDGAMQTQTKTNGHAPEPAPRTCKCGCGGGVPAENRFSYIKGHLARKAKPAKPPSVKLGRPRKTRQADPPAAVIWNVGRPVPPAAPPEPERLALNVTEAQLNRYLVGLDIDWKEFVTELPAKLKLELANAYLLREVKA